MRLLFPALALLGAAVHDPGAPALKELQFHETAVVTGARITLGDAATILPAEAAAALSRLDIGPAPLEGESRPVTVGVIKQFLRRARVSLAGVVIHGPDRVLVKRDRGDAPAAGGTAADGPGAPPATSPGPGPGAGPGFGPGPMVRGGSPVSLVLRRGDLTVSAPGEALSVCATGQLGRFRVVHTKAVVTARLLDSTTAEVVY